MKSSTVKNLEPASAAVAAAPGWSRGWAWVVGAIVSIHLAIALTLMANHVRHSEIVAGSDAWHMHYFHQFSQGGHSYYPRGDVEHVTDGYTPLASQIFGWTIRLFGPDIRAVRMVASLFGLAGMALVGGCAFRLTGSRFLGFIAAALAAGLEVKWFVDVGPNTVHATFSILALYLFLRDPQLSWKTVVLAGLALFASFWSKQLGLAYMVAGTVYVLAKDWRKGAALGAGLAVLTLAGIVYFESRADAQFLYWVFEMNRNQPIIWSRLWTVVFTEILTRKYAVSVAFIAAGLLAYERSWKGLFRPELLLLGAAAVAGGFANGKYGSGSSQMWFFYMAMLVVGLGYAHRFFRDGRLAAPVLGALVALQGLALIDDPRPHFINDEDVGRYRQLMGILSTPGKSSYLVNRGFMSFLAGQKAWPQAGEDSWNKKRFDRNMLSQERRNFLAQDPWDIVIIDIPLEDNSYALYERLEQAYRPLYEIPAATKFPTAYDLRYKKVVFEKKK